MRKFLLILLCGLFIPKTAISLTKLVDDHVDTSAEVFIINLNFQDLDNNKLNRFNAILSTLILSGFTPGSILFINSSTQIAENNTQLFWDETNNRLGISSSTPGGLFTVGNGIFFIDDDGNIGINTSSITATVLFDIQGSVRIFSSTLFQGWDIVGDLDRGNLTQRPVIVASNDGDAYIGVDGDNALHMGVNDVSIIVLTDSKVGIGTSTPKGVVHITDGTNALAPTPSTSGNELIIETNGATGITILSGNSSSGNLLFGDSDDVDIGSINYFHNTEKLAFVTENANRVVLFGDNMGIKGCTSPDHDLTIGGTSTGCDTGTFSEIDAGEATFAISSSREKKKNISPWNTPPNFLSQMEKVKMQRYVFRGYIQSYEIMKSSVSFTSIVHSTWTEIISTKSTFMVVKSTQIPPSNEKIGLMAEDLYELTGEGEPTIIKGDMVIAVMWRAIQELIKEKNDMKERLDLLESK